MSNSRRFELIVLGVGQDAGNPHVGCYKSCCRDPRRACLPASMAIVDRAQNRFWLIDATPSLPQQIRALQALFLSDQAQKTRPPLQLAGILLTHAHIGHYTGLMYCGREAMNSRELPVYAMPRMRNFLNYNGPWAQLVEVQNIKLIALESAGPLNLTEGLSVQPISVPHRGEYSETVAFLIAGPQRRALYLPDIDRWEEMQTPLPQLLTSVDRAWLDATFYDDAELPSVRQRSVPHPPVVDTMELLAGQPSELKNKVHLLHFNHSNPLLNPDSPARERVTALGLHLSAELDRYAL